MPLHPKVNRQNHGDDGGGAKHQNRKQNLHHHRDSGYQNDREQYPLSGAGDVTITGMKNVPFLRIAIVVYDTPFRHLLLTLTSNALPGKRYGKST
jgi:hypothetical protein